MNVQVLLGSLCWFCCICPVSINLTCWQLCSITEFTKHLLRKGKESSIISGYNLLTKVVPFYFWYTTLALFCPIGGWIDIIFGWVEKFFIIEVRRKNKRVGLPITTFRVPRALMTSRDPRDLEWVLRRFPPGVVMRSMIRDEDYV